MEDLVGLRALEVLLGQYAACDLCPALCKSRSQVVFGNGSASADIFIVGGMPGTAEDETGISWMGDAGRLLMGMLAEVWPDDPALTEIENILPNEGAADPNQEYFDSLREYLDGHIFWANSVCCMPPENRPPSHKEIEACEDRLHRTIYAVDPLLILAFGKTAVSALVGKSTKITRKHGDIYDIGIPSPHGGEIRYPMMALLDPAWLLRQGDQALVKEKQGPTWETMQHLKYALQLLDTEYQDIHGTHFPHRPEGA
jgi:DNA polymerase